MSVAMPAMQKTQRRKRLFDSLLQQVYSTDKLWSNHDFYDGAQPMTVVDFFPAMDEEHFRTENRSHNHRLPSRHYATIATFLQKELSCRLDNTRQRMCHSPTGPLRGIKTYFQSTQLKNKQKPTSSTQELLLLT